MRLCAGMFPVTLARGSSWNGRRRKRWHRQTLQPTLPVSSYPMAALWRSSRGLSPHAGVVAPSPTCGGRHLAWRQHLLGSPTICSAYHVLDCKRSFGLRGLISERKGKHRGLSRSCAASNIVCLQETHGTVACSHAQSTILTQWQVLGTFVDGNVNARSYGVLIRKSLLQDDTYWA